jgi:Secretion system C-terminal sorting domain
MKSLLKTILFINIFLASYAGFAQGIQVPVNWRLSLKFDSASQVYTVFGKPDTTYTTGNGWTFAAVQITVLLPDSLPDYNINVISSPTNILQGFAEQDICFGSTTNTTGFDYHSVASINGAARKIYKDSAMKFFSFTLPENCRNFVRLFRNNSETLTFQLGSAVVPADNIDPCQGFSDYSNSIGNGTTFGADAYFSNTNNYGWNCGTFPLAPLDAKMTEFAVRANDCQATISWRTLAEKDVLDYVVMNSTDGVNYKEVGSLPAKGFGAYYSFIHSNPKPGTNYYKVVTRNTNQTILHSNSESVSIYCDGVHDVALFPNPSVDQFDFRIITGSQDNGSEITTQVLDMLGNVVMQKTGKVENGKLVINYKTAAMANGNYMLRYQNDKRNYNGVVKFSKTTK